MTRASVVRLRFPLAAIAALSASAGCRETPDSGGLYGIFGSRIESGPTTKQAAGGLLGGLVGASLGHGDVKIVRPRAGANGLNLPNSVGAVAPGSAGNNGADSPAASAADHVKVALVAAVARAAAAGSFRERAGDVPLDSFVADFPDSVDAIRSAKSPVERDRAADRVVERFANVRATLGRVVLESEPTQAAVAIDQLPLGAPTVVTFWCRAGKRAFRIEKAGFIPQQVEIVVEAGRQVERTVKLAPRVLP